MPAATPPARGEPEVIRRLPEGVEYTRIKMIFMGLPSSLSTLLWRTPAADTPLLAAFQDRTVRAIDRELRRREHELTRLGHDAAATQRKYVSLVRHELVQLCFQELNAPSSPHPDRSISVDHVDPQRFAEHYRPPGPTTPYVRITVRGAAQPDSSRTQVRAESGILEDRTILPQPAPWGDSSIPWFDTELTDRTLLELLGTHFPKILDVRCGSRWRSKYPSVGWPLITQAVVPRLYDYLRPFYPVRHYQDHRQAGPAGHYPAQLRRDIKDIIRAELPHLAPDITVARVTAAIQRDIGRRGQSWPARVKRPKQ